MIDIQSIPALPQRQDSTLDQLVDLRSVANRLGMYDAADVIRNVIDTANLVRPECTLPHAPYTPNDCNQDHESVPAPEWMHHAIQLLFGGYKINAVKVLRNGSGLILKDALLIMTHLEKHFKLGVYDPRLKSFLAEKPLCTMTPTEVMYFDRFVALAHSDYDQMVLDVTGNLP